MKNILQSRGFFLLILVTIIVVCASLVYRIFIVGSAAANCLLQASITPGATHALTATAQPGATLPPALGMCHLKGRNFQMGIAFPEWSLAGYGGGDQQWLSALPQMRAQTSACNAVLANIFNDEHILGSFFSGWDNVAAFNLKGTQAASTIQTLYQFLQG